MLKADSLLLDFKGNNSKLVPEEICFYLENRELEMNKMIALQVLFRTMGISGLHSQMYG